MFAAPLVCSVFFRVFPFVALLRVFLFVCFLVFVFLFAQNLFSAQHSAKDNLFSHGSLPKTKGSFPGSNIIDSHITGRPQSQHNNQEEVPDFENATRTHRHRRHSRNHYSDDSESQDNDVKSQSDYSDSDSQESTPDPDEKPPTDTKELTMAVQKEVITVDPQLYRRVKKAKNPRSRFQMAWWFVIYTHDKRADYIQHLVKSGFNAPPWVTFEAPFGKPPFTTQWGNLAITLPAVSHLFKCFAYKFRNKPKFVLFYLSDEIKFFRTYSMAMAALFDKRAIAEAIIAAIDRWCGTAKLTPLFIDALLKSDFDKVKMNHYRVDSIPSGSYSLTKGCISPSIFQKIAKDECSGLAKKLANNNSPKKPFNRPFNRRQPINPNYNPYYGYIQRRNQSNTYQPTSNFSNYIPPAPRSILSVHSAPTPHQSMSTALAPSGVPYPSKSSIVLPTASLDKPFPLYAPRLEYFATAANFPPTPPDQARSFSDYLTKLGRCPPYYCADYQVNNQCTRARCDFHHLCEWCASKNHSGNQCPYRPISVGFRKKSRNSQATTARAG